ncbi:MAG: (d)CMP kinase [Gammaproteobacteria bacterium]|nr:(d)CMP kinase [Gammaproteobacteria bacterium]MBV8403033.1 (d)CMP kinase [Gammaproteobacteria bacterium]
MRGPPACPIVTIDGPSGSGKGTISRALARKLGWHLLDSGALYRLVAIAGVDAGAAADDEGAHAALARRMDAVFSVAPDGSECVTLGGRDVTGRIRSEEAGQGASRVAAWPAVREALLARQRAFAAPPGLVADGRDMGTVVFPGAELKVFLTATPQERALRRHKQLKDKGSDVSLPALSREIAERDLRDQTREVAPLKAAPDAHLIDSTGLSVEAVVQRVLDLGAARSLWP